eukprot:m.85145 g.85145  ORF g.85145 m.85145 type:complete len:484 (+) comp8230_c0_seq1:28-1479(+)
MCITWRVLAVLLLAAGAHAARYTAASVQLSPLGTYTAAPAENVQLNLDQISAVVAGVHADIIVLPEAVMWSLGLSTRATMAEYAETIDSASSSAPCDSIATGQLHTFSCLARAQQAVLVANMVTRVPCTPAQDPACPADHMFLYNTDVAFDETGAVLQVYHKMHIFGTAPILDQPAVADPAAFTTSFGVEFGMLICYDMEFPEPVDTLKARGVRHFVASMSWMNDAPLFSAIMFQQGWSRAHGVALIAANRADNGRISGGGIYAAGAVMAAWFNVSSVKDPHVVIGTVDFDGDADIEPPKRGIPPSEFPVAPPAAHALSAAQTTCTTAVSDAAPCTLFRAAPGSQQTVSVMAGTLFCHAKFAFSSTGFPEMQYALLAKQDTLTFPGTPDGLVLETCAVIACPASPSDGPASCSPLWDGAAVFAGLDIEANFAPGQLLPMLADGKGQLLPPSIADFSPAGLLRLAGEATLTSAVLYNFPANATA